MQTKLKPNAEGLIGVGVHFERIRRVTGYLVGTLDRFNDGKRAEERDRVKHMHVWYTLVVVIKQRSNLVVFLDLFLSFSYSQTSIEWQDFFILL